MADSTNQSGKVLMTKAIKSVLWDTIRAIIDNYIESGYNKDKGTLSTDG